MVYGTVSSCIAHTVLHECNTIVCMYLRLTSTLADEDEMLYGNSSQPTAVTTTQMNMEQS